MFGRQTLISWFRRLRRRDFTLRTAAAGFAVVALIIFAIYDLTTTSAATAQQVQESELKGQLAQFLLSTREADGSSLFENPIEFSKASRPIQVVSLRRSFFAYVLNSGNVRSFKASDLRLEPPRACVVEFSAGQPTDIVTTLQACFATIPGDATGRYVYFFLRYPTSKIRRHQAGKPIADSHHLLLTFSGQRETKLTIVFQMPPLVRARYPSQMARFEDIHELAGFNSEEAGMATRYVKGQAYERMQEENGNPARNFVTLVGRIDASMLLANTGEGSGWPSAAIKSLSIGVRTYGSDAASTKIKEMIDVPPKVDGTAQISLAKSYLATVLSRARLEVSAHVPGSSREVIWRSDDAGITQSSRQEGLLQRVSDWWTKTLVSLKGVHDHVIVTRQSLYVAGKSEVTASLTAVPIVLPEIATRAFTWLSLALVAIFFLWIYWFKAVVGLQRITGTAYSMIVRPSGEGTLSAYAGRSDEIGTLGRIFHLLITRNRSRSASLNRRQRQEENSRVEDLRLAEAHVQNRKAILDAIGHEIRSPLQSLLRRTRGDSDVQHDLERVKRAVDALHQATSVEDGLRNGDFIVERHDLAIFLQRLASNLRETGKPVGYIGPVEGVPADFDPIQLEQILDNLIENALRHRTQNTDIELRLEKEPGAVKLSVFNHGPNIPDADLERIFDYGVTDSTSAEHMGLGLFASRIYALAMRATIRGENHPSGVAMVIVFPSTDTV